MDIRIQTLTPLWTGGVDGSMDRIHETAIIGSMRWWYEAIVRGLGGSACDPSNNKCSFNAEAYRRSSAVDERQRLRDAGLCDVCQLFGATGWRRKFRLDVVDMTKPIWTQENRMLNIRPPDRNRGWFLPPGHMGELILNFAGDGQTLRLLGALVLFLEKWGNLGAKPQLGYGVFKITNRSELQRLALHSWHDDEKLYKNRLKKHNKSDIDKPDLRRFGFCRYRFSPQRGVWWTYAPGMERSAVQVQPLVAGYKTIPLSPSLKNEWRFRRWHRQWQGDLSDEMWMFGALKLRGNGETKRVRSKVAVSWAYPQDGAWEVRAWAWLQEPEWLHGSKIAGEVWDLVRDESSWKAVIKAQGQIETRPTGGWHEWSTSDVAEFLEEAK